MHPPPQPKAKCFRCGATAQAPTFEQARSKLDHAIGLGRGIPCGDSFGKVKEIGKPKPPVPKPIPQTKPDLKTKPSQSKTISNTAKNNTSPQIEKNN